MAGMLSSALAVTDKAWLAAAGDAGILPEPAAAAAARDLIPLIEAVGGGEPIDKIYTRAEPAPELPTLLFLLIISLIPQYRYSRRLAMLERVPGRRGVPDAAAVAAGIATVLRHYPESHTGMLLQHVGQFVRIYVQVRVWAGS